MARVGRKITVSSLEGKIEKQKELLQNQKPGMKQIKRNCFV